MKCQVDGCNKKGDMVKGIELQNPAYGSISLTVFLCEQHNDDKKFMVEYWEGGV